MGRGRGQSTKKTQVHIDPRQAFEGSVPESDADLTSRITELESSLAYHKNLYYNLSAPEISDAEYDAIEEELKRLREAHPVLANSIVADEDSSLNQVGASFYDTQFNPVKHETPMLSLDKVHTSDDLKKWMEKYPGEKLSIWPKFDGVSLSITYKDGQLVRAASRGDGKIGEDITANAVRVNGVHRTLDQKIDCEVRGEVVMLKSDFNSYNAANPGKPLSNPRNAVSGTMRLKDTSSESAKARKLTFYAFDVIIDEDPDPNVSLNDRLVGLGFDTRGYAEANTAEDVLKYIEKTEADRDGLDYEIDGVVIKIADPEKYSDLGNTSKHPRGAMAMKLAAEIGESEIESVEWAVGKTGKVTPRAKIKKMFLSGTNISYATLHNPDDIRRKGIRVGQRIQIKRAGDVIPFIIGPVDGQGDIGNKIDVPTNCPSCGSLLEEIGESKILQCNNAAACPEQSSRRLDHWVSRGGADIEGLSTSTLEKLEESGRVKSPSDIYTLEVSDIENLEGMGKRSAENIISAIQGKKELGLRKAIVAWSIPNASEGTAKRLCRNGYESPEQIAAAAPEELARVEDVGQVVAESLHEFFNDPKTVEEVEKLRKAGVNLDVLEEDRPVVLDASNTKALTGKSICLTGKLSISRGAFKKELEAIGAKPTSSVSKNTDFLLAGEDAGSKRQKAADLGVRILSEAEARSMM